MRDKEWDLLQNLHDNGDLTEEDYERYGRLIALEAQEYLANADV